MSLASDINKIYLEIVRRDKRFLHVPFEVLFRSAMPDLEKLLGGGGSVDTYTAADILYTHSGFSDISNVKEALDKLLFVPITSTVNTNYTSIEYGSKFVSYLLTITINRSIEQLNTAYVYYTDDVANKLNVLPFLSNLSDGSAYCQQTINGEFDLLGSKILRFEANTVIGEVTISNKVLQTVYRAYYGTGVLDILGWGGLVEFSTIPLTNTLISKGKTSLTFTPTNPASKFYFGYPLIMGNCNITFGNFNMNLPYYDVDVIGPKDTITYRFFESEYPLNVVSIYNFTIN